MRTPGSGDPPGRPSGRTEEQTDANRKVCPTVSTSFLFLGTLLCSNYHSSQCSESVSNYKFIAKLRSTGSGLQRVCFEYESSETFVLQAIAEGLQGKSALKVLYLFKNRIRDSGLEALEIR